MGGALSGGIIFTIAYVLFGILMAIFFPHFSGFPQEEQNLYLELYFENNCTSSFFDYINYTLERADKCKIWNFDELKNRKYSTPVSDLIQQASTNLDARKKLIEKYQLKQL